MPPAQPNDAYCQRGRAQQEQAFGDHAHQSRDDIRHRLLDRQFEDQVLLDHQQSANRHQHGGDQVDKMVQVRHQSGFGPLDMLGRARQLIQIRRIAHVYQLRLQPAFGNITAGEQPFIRLLGHGIAFARQQQFIR